MVIFHFLTVARSHSGKNNEALDKTCIYEYNSIGNIKLVKAYDFSLSVEPEGDCTPTTYEYDTTYPDRLISFNGNAITYDAQGYPTLYKGKFFSWIRGKLNRIYRGSSTQVGYAHEDCTFTHNAYGQRTSKSYVYDVSLGDSGDGSYSYDTTYQYDQSGRLIREFITERDAQNVEVTRDFTYLYDECGIVGVMYSANGSTPQPYYYHRNLQGDVIAIYNTSGDKIVEYAYDAWGNCTIVYAEDLAFAEANPIRYRGYYYDRETGLYYLNARYYNPEWRRFISPDAAEYIDPETPNGLNLYAYCNNDPVNLVDPSGHLAFWLAAGLVIGAVGLIGGGTYAGIKSSQAGNTGWDLVSDIAFGAVIGGIVGFAAGAIIGAGVSGLLTGSFLSSVQAVKAGAILTHQMFRLGGRAAGLYMMLDNLSNAFNSPLHVFWSGGEIAKNQAVSYANQNGGITLEMTRLGKYLKTLPYDRLLWGYASQNFANQVSNNGIVRAILYYPGMRGDAIWFTEKEILVKKMVEIIIGSLS